MLRMLADRWWALVLRGVLALLFGVTALFLPGPTLAALVLLFGAFAFVDGAFALATAIGRGRARRDWWLPLLQGVFGIGIGILTVINPAITAIGLLLYIAAWTLLVGVLQVITAIRLRREMEHEWMLALSGIASVVFGALMVWQPGAGALAVIWLIGVWAIVWGLLLLAAGLRLRGYVHELGGRPAHG